ncbi:MAG: hypothetical protein STSR0007_02770 [Thermovirga sp.]
MDAKREGKGRLFAVQKIEPGRKNKLKIYISNNFKALSGLQDQNQGRFLG